MKKYILTLLSFAFIMTGCGLDNYDGPKSMLTGKVTYNGQPIYLSHGTISMNLYQDGYVKNGPIPVYLDKDGSFSALLFDGDYRLQTAAGAAPWADAGEEMRITVKGNTTHNIEVTPFFMISDVAIALNGSEVKALCNVEKIAGGKTARQIFLCVNNTPFVSDYSYNCLLRKNQMPVSIGGNSLSLDISEILDYNKSLYARIGIQISGISECIYSETIQIK